MQIAVRERERVKENTVNEANREPWENDRDFPPPTKKPDLLNEVKLLVRVCIYIYNICGSGYVISIFRYLGSG